MNTGKQAALVSAAIATGDIKLSPFPGGLEYAFDMMGLALDNGDGEDREEGDEEERRE